MGLNSVLIVVLKIALSIKKFSTTFYIFILKMKNLSSSNLFKYHFPIYAVMVRVTFTLI